MRLCHCLLYFTLLLDRRTRVARASLMIRNGLSREGSSLNIGELEATLGKMEHFNNQEGNREASVYGLGLNQNRIPIHFDFLELENRLVALSLFSFEINPRVDPQAPQKIAHSLSDLLLGIQEFENRNRGYWKAMHKKHPDPMTRPRVLFDDVEHKEKIKALIDDATKLFVMAQSASSDVSRGNLVAAGKKIGRARMFQRAVENAQFDLMKSGGYVDLDFASPEYRIHSTRFVKSLFESGLKLSRVTVTPTPSQSELKNLEGSYGCVRQVFEANQELHNILLDFQEGQRAKDIYKRSIGEVFAPEVLRDFLEYMRELGDFRRRLLAEFLAGNVVEVNEGIARVSSHIVDARSLFIEAIFRGKLAEAILSHKEYNSDYLELQNQIARFETGDYLDWKNDESNCRAKFQILTKAIKTWYKDLEDFSEKLSEARQKYILNHKRLSRDSGTGTELDQATADLVQNSIEELDLFINAKNAIDEGSYNQAFAHLKELRILGTQENKYFLERVNQGFFHRMIDMDDDYQSKYNKMKGIQEEIKTKGWYSGVDKYEAEKRKTADLFNLYNSIEDFNSFLKRMENNPGLCEQSYGVLPELVRINIMNIPESTRKEIQDPKRDKEIVKEVLEKSLLVIDKMNQVSERIKRGEVGLVQGILEEAVNLKAQADILRAQRVLCKLSDVPISSNSLYNSKCQFLQGSLRQIRLIPGPSESGHKRAIWKKKKKR